MRRPSLAKRGRGRCGTHFSFKANFSPPRTTPLSLAGEGGAHEVGGWGCRRKAHSLLSLRPWPGKTGRDLNPCLPPLPMVGRMRYCQEIIPEPRPPMTDLPTFQTIEDFESWLEDKPAVWAQAIAVRVALRVLPVVARATDAGQGSEMMAVFRATLFSACVVLRRSHRNFISAAHPAMARAYEIANNFDVVAVCSDQTAVGVIDATANSARAVANAASAAGHAAYVAHVAGHAACLRDAH